MNPDEHRSAGLLLRITVAWALLFGLVHAYWAAGGSLGMDEPATDPAAQAYIAVIALIGFASAGIALGLVRPWGERLGRGRLRLLACVGSIALALGVTFNAIAWIADSSQLSEDGASGIAVWTYFLAGSVCFGLLARRARAPRLSSSRWTTGASRSASSR